MADWMNIQLRNGQKTGAMMWGSPTILGSTCRQWMDTHSRASISGAASPAWCNEMVGWMQRHIGDRVEWMMHGSMMGR